MSLSASFSEPMVLGSPGSPKPLSGLLNSSGVGTPSHFAPNFLLGSTSSSSTGSYGPYGGRGDNSFHSLSKVRHSSAIVPHDDYIHNLHHTPSVGSNATIKALGQKVTWSPDLVQEIPPKRMISMRTGPVLGGAPPLRTLNSDINSSGCAFNESAVKQLGLLDESRPAETSTRENLSPTQVDPFFTQGPDFNPSTDLDPHWITVFGFPPESATYILEQFARYGTVVKHEIPSKGNWLHIRYQSPLQAKKALSKNSKIFADSIQVGVTHCIDKTVITRNPVSGSDTSFLSPNLSAFADSNVFSSSMGSYLPTSPPFSANVLTSPPVSNKSSVGSIAPSSGGDPNLSNKSVTGMRSLTAAYNAAGSPYQVVGGSNTPQKAEDRGVLTKAWGYVFGN